MPNSPTLSRRSWLAGASIAAEQIARAALAPVHLPHKVRIAIIGAQGHMGEITSHLKEAPDVELVAVADPDAQAAARFARGPLAGIHAVLRSSSSQLNLILAVDLPLVEADFLKYLVRRAEAEISRQAESGDRAVMAVVPRAAGGWQPLCAVYSKQFAGAAEQALRQKRYKIDALFAQGSVCPIPEAEILQAGFSPQMFDNLNTPEEFELAQRRAQ